MNYMISQMYLIFRVFKAALSLDVADLNYVYKPHSLEHTILSHTTSRKSGIVRRIVSFCSHIVYDLWRGPLRFPVCLLSSPLFFALTHNQDRALRPLAQSIADCTFLGNNKFGDSPMPLFWAFILSIPFFPLVIYKFIQSRGAERKAFYYVFDLYWLSYGFYIFMRLALQKYKPTAVIMANDHVMWTRVLIRACADEKTPSIYLQHASVTERFPPLSFDFALLEGVDAAQKYASCGDSETDVFLIGAPSFDRYYSLLNNENAVQNIGICVGLMDSRENLLSLCQALNESLHNLHFILRSHPRDQRSEMWQALTAEFGWALSNGGAEDTFQFLSRVDAILAGDSNILLEAAMMNVLAIYYDFSGKKLDWYGFHKNGLTPYFSQPDEVVTYVQDMVMNGRSSIRSQAKHYCATIDTEYDGRSTELAVHLIKKITSPNKIDEERANWEPIPDVLPLKAWQLPEKGSATIDYENQPPGGFVHD